MVITAIKIIEKKSKEKYSKAQYKVVTNQAEEIVLEHEEIEKYNLAEGMELTEQTYKSIYQETVVFRAKKKALRILERMDRSEKELKNKLTEAGFPEDAAGQALEYVKSFHYIDDTRYAKNYIKAREAKKSKRQLEQELREKGIASVVVSELLAGSNQEEEAVRSLIQKKTHNRTELTLPEKKKLAASLYRKGFSLDSIRRQLDLPY